MEKMLSEDGRFEYALDAGGQASVIRYLGKEECVLVPARIGPHRVTAVGGFSKTKVSRVIIPQGVRRIESRAFYGCGKMKRHSLESIASQTRTDRKSMLDMPEYQPQYVVDENGDLCVLGEGNTPSQAYYNRIPVKK